MKIKTPRRPNFSRSAKLCDQNLYHVSTPNYDLPPNYQSPKSKEPQKNNQNYFFKSVSRNKRNNFRFKIFDPQGQFIYYPNYNFGKQKSPTWAFPKGQKYENQKFIEYEFCQKHPIMRENQQAKMRATQSMKSFVKDKVKMSKSTSMVSTSVDISKNYSILDPRKTSPTGFFNQTKIATPRYLSKKELCDIEAEEDHKKYTQRLFSTQRGFVDFQRQQQRKPNVVRKSFEYFEKSYDHQKQFNNFQLTQYPIKPQYHISFEEISSRPQLFNPQRLGPNPQINKIDFTRKKDNNINYKLSTFRDKIRTRYDRTDPEPNTRLDIQIPQPKLPGMVSMQRVKSRSKELFPIIDPIIKKPGDKEMREQLKKSIFQYEVNQALKPLNPDIAIQNALK